MTTLIIIIATLIFAIFCLLLALLAIKVGISAGKPNYTFNIGQDTGSNFAEQLREQAQHLLDNADIKLLDSGEKPESSKKKKKKEKSEKGKKKKESE